MSLRDRLFKPRWQHRDAQVRAAAVASSDAVELVRQLARIAREDQDAHVRRAAIARLTQLDNLLPCALEEQDPAVREFAQERLLPLILKAKPCPGAALPLIERWENQDLLERVVTQAQDPELRRNALQRCQRQGFLGQWASKDPVAANRALALSKITQESTLRQLAERLRRSDKSLYRQVMERLDQSANSHKASEAHAERLCQQAEALARGQGVSALSEQLAQLQQAWAQLQQEAGETEPLPAGLVRRFTGALDILQAALRGPQEETAAPPPVIADSADTGHSEEAATSTTAGAEETAPTPEPEPSEPAVNLARLATQLERWEQALADEAERLEAERRARAERAAARKAARRKQQAPASAVKSDTASAEATVAGETAETPAITDGNASPEHTGPGTTAPSADQPGTDIPATASDFSAEANSIAANNTEQEQSPVPIEKAPVETNSAEGHSETARGAGKAHSSARPPRLNQLRRWHDDWQRAWPGVKATQADQALAQTSLAQWQKLQQQLEQQQARQHRAEQQLLEIAGQLRAALEQKQLATAVQQIRSGQKLIRQQQLRQPPGWRELQAELDHQRELLEWALASKHQELQEQASELVTSELHPDATLERLRELRHGWQQLDEQARQVSLRQYDQAAASTFNQTCNAAMERIKPFLEKRQQVRNERAEQLQGLASQVQEQLAGEQADKKELLALRRQLIQALRELAGVPRQQRQAIAQQLRDSLTTLDQHLNTLEQAALVRKQQLIRSATTLAEAESLKDVVAQVRELQDQWRQAGQVRRSQEQKLWKEFRTPIDAIFARLDAAREERAAAHQALEQVWEEQVQAVDQLAAEAAEIHASASLEQSFRNLRQGWEDSQVRSAPLQQRWRTAADTIKNRLQQLQAAAAAASRDHHWHAALAWQQWLDARLQEQPAEAPAAPSAYQRELLELAPEALVQRLNEALEQASQLCLAIEYLAGLDSPADQQQARMTYQVQRLAERMGQASFQPSPQEELEQLEQAWFALQPLAPEQAAAYQQRFRNAWELAIKTL